jgi:hypothetical protein
VDTGSRSFEGGERFYFVALSFGGFPEVALSLKVKPEVGVGVEGLRQAKRHVGGDSGAAI